MSSSGNQASSSQGQGTGDFLHEGYLYNQGNYTNKGFHSYKCKSWDLTKLGCAKLTVWLSSNQIEVEKHVANCPQRIALEAHELKRLRDQKEDKKKEEERQQQDKKKEEERQQQDKKKEEERQQQDQELSFQRQQHEHALMHMMKDGVSIKPCTVIRLDTNNGMARVEYERDVGTKTECDVRLPSGELLKAKIQTDFDHGCKKCNCYIKENAGLFVGFI